MVSNGILEQLFGQLPILIRFAQVVWTNRLQVIIKEDASFGVLISNQFVFLLYCRGGFVGEQTIYDRVVHLHNSGPFFI